MSNKVDNADNQQERLMMIGWIVGFVDGEGCFTVNFVKQPDRKEKNRIRRGYKIGVQVSHEFAVTQGESSLDSLKKMKKFFGVGNLFPNQRHDNHKENLYRFVVRKREDLNNIIIPFFKKYPLKTSKNKNFRLFVKCLQKINEKDHLTKKGMIEIVKLSEQMNSKKSKEDIIKILRNQTSDSN